MRFLAGNQTEDIWKLTEENEKLQQRIASIETGNPENNNFKPVVTVYGSPSICPIKPVVTMDVSPSDSTFINFKKVVLLL